jgi:hypothetical protein
MNNRKSKVIITLFLVFFTLACTLPSFLTPSPIVEERIIYVEITSTPKSEDSSDADTDEDEHEAVIEEVDPVSINIDGPWTIWQGNSEQQLSIDFLQQEYEIIGNAATDNGHSLLFEGTIAQDGKSVSGTWESTSGTDGVFMMKFDEQLSSFSGNLGGGVPFCGDRAESTKPDPCLE